MVDDRVLSLRLDGELVDKIDEEWKEMGFDNRTEYIRYKLRDGNNKKDLHKKIERLEEEGEDLVEEGERKLKEAEFLREKLEKGGAGAYEIKEKLVDLVMSRYMKQGGRIYHDEKYSFIISTIPDKVDGEIEWRDEDEAARLLEVHKPPKDREDEWDEHAERTVDEWIDQDLIMYKEG